MKLFRNKYKKKILHVHALICNLNRYMYLRKKEEFSFEKVNQLRKNLQVNPPCLFEFNN